MKKITLAVIFCTAIQLAGAQSPGKTAADPNNLYKSVYPIGEGGNMSYKTNYNSKETILFEANPIARFSFYNNVRRRLLLTSEQSGLAFYAVFKPQLRMYVDSSLPVKMPSYKIELGFQKVYKVKGVNLFAWAIESGHYSNGQSGSAFSESFKDGSAQSDSIYRLITPSTDLAQILNRTNGNFSTNLTELLFSYRINHTNDFWITDRTHLLKLGILLYHDRFWGIGKFGGYSDDDIKLMGRWRLSFGYEYQRLFANSTRLTGSFDAEYIAAPHPSVKKWRTELKGTYYPVKKYNEWGLFAAWNTGHDNYNFRFVDGGSQLAIGFCWTVFPPLEIRAYKPK